MNEDREFRFSKLEIISGLTGGLCPIPVVGEVLFAVPLYKSVKVSGVVGESKYTAGAIALCVSALTRYLLYEPFYFPMLNLFSRLVGFK